MNTYYSATAVFDFLEGDVNAEISQCLSRADPWTQVDILPGDAIDDNTISPRVVTVREILRTTQQESKGVQAEAAEHALTNCSRLVLTDLLLSLAKRVDFRTSLTVVQSKVERIEEALLTMNCSGCSVATQLNGFCVDASRALQHILLPRDEEFVSEYYDMFKHSARKDKFSPDIAVWWASVQEIPAIKDVVDQYAIVAAVHPAALKEVNNAEADLQQLLVSRHDPAQLFTLASNISQEFKRLVRQTRLRACVKLETVLKSAIGAAVSEVT